MIVRNEIIILTLNLYINDKFSSTILHTHIYIYKTAIIKLKIIIKLFQYQSPLKSLVFTPLTKFQNKITDACTL